MNFFLVLRLLDNFAPVTSISGGVLLCKFLCLDFTVLIDDIALGSEIRIEIANQFALEWINGWSLQLCSLILMESGGVPSYQTSFGVGGRKCPWS
ncbi:hypothetical protein L2E82_11930 [Cichorium intybus]|uniref:Uncharacterized protein n=1 Tax=Cichorium intybus TaxID=13427 RepID=A0ACB9GGN0_CICIN|nr:hypothetical protein L2E82_11930 [Cichorium intybus]